MQGLPPHLPGSIVIRGWDGAVMPKVYLSADQRVMPTHSDPAITVARSSRIPGDLEKRPHGGNLGAEPLGGGAFLLRDRLLGLTLSAAVDIKSGVSMKVDCGTGRQAGT
jgi:hypothetical protein